MEWPRGEAAACKAVYVGSNPISTSQQHHPSGAIGAAVARFPDTEEVTGSIPVSRTDKAPVLRNRGRCARGADSPASDVPGVKRQGDRAPRDGTPVRESAPQRPKIATSGEESHETATSGVFVS